MATKSKATEVVATNPFQMTEGVPSYINQGVSRGSEEVKSTDMVLPRLELIQALSPIKDENPEEAKEGYLFNSVTREIIGDHAYFVPVYFKMEYLVWKDQDKGGGFFGSFASEGEAKDRVNEAIAAGESPDDLEIVDTPVQYGLRVQPDGQSEQIVISMAKTKAKVSRKWNAMIQIVGGDRFSRVYKLSSFKDENAKGQKFFNFVVQPAGFTPEKAYREAERLYEILKTQEFRVAHETVVDNEAQQKSSERGEI